MRRAIIFLAAIFTVAALMRWWLRWQEARHTPAEEARYSDVARGDAQGSVGAGDMDLDDWQKGK